MLKTSVDPEEWNVNSKYDESLKEFLKPTIQNADLNNNKFGKKIKMHAQVLGVNNETARLKKKEKRTKEKIRTKETSKITSKVTSGVIKGLKDQIKELKNTIEMVCNSIVIEEETKETIMNKMNNVNEASIEQIENQLETEVEVLNENLTQKNTNKGKKGTESKNVGFQVRRHPNSTGDISGDVNKNKIWHQRLQDEKKHDQQIKKDQQVKKSRHR